MSDHTVPEGAAKAGARALASDGIESPNTKATMVLLAEHEAGEIVWREEHEALASLVEYQRESWADQQRAAEEEQARADEAVALLRETTDELDRWGHGDMHYGSTGQDKRVVERVAANREWLATQEPPTQEGPT